MDVDSDPLNPLTCRCSQVFLSESWLGQPSCGSYELTAKRSHCNVCFSKSVTNISCNIKHIHTYLHDYLQLYDIYSLYLCCTCHVHTCRVCHFALQALGGHPFLRQPSRLKATLSVHVSPFHWREDQFCTHFWPFSLFSDLYSLV